MIRFTNSVKVNGMEGVTVMVECNIEKGIGIHVVGIADQKINEILLRSVTALQANAFRIPGKKIVINLAPADLCKSGSGYDLPIALAVIAASEQKTLPDLEKWLITGELGLDGSVRSVPGCVQAVDAAKKEGFKGCIIPRDNAVEVAPLFDDSFPVYAVNSLSQAIEVVTGDGRVQEYKAQYIHLTKDRYDRAGSLSQNNAWESLVGNESGRRAALVAAAGAHNMLLIGAPGSGKDSISKAVWELLPLMSHQECLQVAKIYSAAGVTSRYDEISKIRPYRNPHISLSLRTLLGGGAGDVVLPGEVSLAHNGVLTIHDITDAPKAIQEALRGPLDDTNVVISRLRNKVTYPADFIFIATANPCPCSYYGAGDKCTCTAHQREAYMNHLSPAIMDRLTIQLWTHEPLTAPAEDNGLSLQEARDVVRKVRARMAERYSQAGVTNDNVHIADLEADCLRCSETVEMLNKIIERLGLNARAYTRILRIARTIADIEDSDEVQPQHVAEAASFRFLDRQNPV